MKALPLIGLLPLFGPISRHRSLRIMIIMLTKKICLKVVNRRLRGTFYWNLFPNLNTNKRRIIPVLIVAILLMILLSTTIIYFNNTLNEKSSEINKLTNEISGLKNQIKNLTSANIVTLLEIKNREPHKTPVFHPGLGFNYRSLGISGSANNTGPGTAYNSGLIVVAYDDKGNLSINMTIPLGNGNYGPDSLTNTTSYLRNNFYSGESMRFSIFIYHSDNLSNWTITPVWTTTP